MAVHIRLSRAGTKKNPFYRIVVADQRAPARGKFIENIGTFDPSTDKVTLNAGRVSYWRDNGALPSHTVGLLLKRPGVLAATAAK